MLDPQFQPIQEAIERGEFVAALKLLDAQADHPDVSLLRVRAYRALGANTLALSSLEQLLTTRSSDDDLAEQCLVLSALGRNEEARTIALSMNQTIAARSKVLAAGLRFEEKYGEALQVIDAGIKASGRSSILLAERAAILGDLLNQQGDAAQAWADMLDALKDSVHDTAWGMLVLTFSRLHENEVKARLEQMNDQTKDPFFLLRLGHFHREMKRPAEALRFVELAFADPQTFKSEFAHVLRIAALDEAGDSDEAATAAQAALQRFPDNMRFAYQLVPLALGLGRFDLADEGLQALEKRKGVTLELAGHRIDFLRLQGKTTDALALAAHHVDDAGKSPELLRNIAYLYAICRRYAAARELLDKHSSDSDSVLATKILIRIIEGDFEDALRVAEGVKVASAAVLGLKAWLLAYQAKFDEAHALLDHAETLNIDSTPKTVRVEVLLMEGKLDKALEKARAAFAELPRNLDVLLNLAQIHLARNERKEALEFARLASSRDASLTSPVQIETLALLRDGRRHEALMTVERAIERFGRTSGLLQCRGYVRLLTEETMTFAQRDFMEALVEPRPGLIARTGLGAIAYRRREYDEAEKRFTEIMNLQPFSLDAKTNLAWTYVAGGNVAKMEQAEKLCMGVLERDESNARALGCLGALAYRRGERRKAESVLRLAAPDDEKSDIENLVNRGAAEAKLGKYDAAAASLAAALKRNPNHARALVEQSTLQLKRGLTKESRESAQASVDANGHVAATWRALAAAALAQKEEKEAELILRRALAHVDTAERADVEIDLARLLVNAADARSGDPRLRDAIEMLTRVLDAGGPSEANLLYGVAQLKLGDASAALSALDKAKNDERLVGHVTSLRRIAADMKRSAMASSVSQWGLAAVVMINMIALWIWVIADPSKSGGFQVLLPITLALLIIAVVLPRLVSLKVVAVEAQLAVAPREIRPEALVGPAAEIDMQPALDPLVGALAYDL